MTYRGAFNSILWGFVFTILDIEIGGIDLLLDPLGYMGLAFGAGALSEAERPFKTAQALSCLLVLVSLVEAFLYTLYPVQLLRAVLDLFMIWFLLGGIILLARSRQRPELAERTEKIRLVGVVLSVTLMVLGPLAPMLGGLAIFIGAIVMLTFLGFMIHLLYQARAELGAE
jgi:hypothetical protein